MDRRYLFVAGLVLSAVLRAQSGAFQFFAISSGGRTLNQDSLPLPPTEAAKPFSATASVRTHDSLLNGNQVDMTATMPEYRDAEGRVRTGEMRASSSIGSFASSNLIAIYDPVAGVNYLLDPAKKTAVKAAMVGGTATISRGNAMTQPQIGSTVSIAPPSSRGQNDFVENLGTTTVNGVTARGTRTTVTIPIGAIGNDRELRSVTERWFSSDLNLLIKSVSSDPRFGTTTYELLNVSRTPPDPSLFQVPADYLPAK